MGTTCGIIGTAEKYHIEGYKIPFTSGGGNCLRFPAVSFYSLDAPVLVSGTQGDGAAVITYAACTVPGANQVDGMPVCPAYP